MGKRKQLSIAGLFLIILSACKAGELTQAASPTNWGNTTVIYYPSKTPNTPEPEVTPTAIATISTVIPIKTPTEGPPPDLELLNLTLRYRGDGFGILFGEIRNNTDAAMVFPGEKHGRDIPILRFKVEAWEWYDPLGVYWHKEFSVGRGSGYGQNTNCFLYPGEIGVISIGTSQCQNYPENCISEYAFIEKPPEATGMQLLGYQDLKTFIPWPDLSPDYHPQVENLEFSKTGQRINFGFDLPKSVFNPYYNIMTWVMVFDEEGEMLGILKRPYSEELKIDNGEGAYRITGYYQTSSDPGAEGNNYFRGDLLDEDIDRIDHIQVMVEKQHTYLCYSYRYELYREYMANHPEESGA